MPSPDPSSPSGEVDARIDRYRPLVVHVATDVAMSAALAFRGPLLTEVGERALAVAAGQWRGPDAGAFGRFATIRIRQAMLAALHDHVADGGTTSGPTSELGDLDLDAPPAPIAVAFADDEGGSWRRILVDALEALPEPLRRVVTDLFLEQRTVEAVAERLGVSPEEVVAQRTQALRLLGAGLERSTSLSPPAAGAAAAHRSYRRRRAVPTTAADADGRLGLAAGG